MIKVVSENIDSNKYRVTFYLPYYDSEENIDDELAYPSIPFEGISETDIEKQAQKYIASKKRSNNSKMWKDAIIHKIDKE